MRLSMKEILDKYNDANKFSLTGNYSGYKIAEEEFMNAIEDMEEHSKSQRREEYQNSIKDFYNYPEFDELYEEIKEECMEYYQEKNNKSCMEKLFDTCGMKQYNQMEVSNNIFDKFLDKAKKSCTSIVDKVGKTTKYGRAKEEYFWNLYNDIAMNIDRMNDKEKYLSNGVLDPMDVVPKELKEYLLYYKVSFHNEVSTRSILMINYYFVLNDATKKYLLKFKDDFNMDELEDLTLYKDDQVLFYSCTHEKFNSLSDE